MVGDVFEWGKKERRRKVEEEEDEEKTVGRVRCSAERRDGLVD
jgi:hypothetical protein